MAIFKRSYLFQAINARSWVLSPIASFPNSFGGVFLSHHFGISMLVYQRCTWKITESKQIPPGQRQLRVAFAEREKVPRGTGGNVEAPWRRSEGKQPKGCNSCRFFGRKNGNFLTFLYIMVLISFKCVTKYDLYIFVPLPLVLFLWGFVLTNSRDLLRRKRWM